MSLPVLLHCAPGPRPVPGTQCRGFLLLNGVRASYWAFLLKGNFPAHSPTFYPKLTFWFSCKVVFCQGLDWLHVIISGSARTSSFPGGLLMVAESLIIWNQSERRKLQAGLKAESPSSFVQGRVRNLGTLKVLFFLLFSSSLSQNRNTIAWNEETWFDLMMLNSSDFT